MAIIDTGAVMRAFEAMSASSNMSLKIYPTTKSTAHASAASRNVRIQLENGSGQVHEWYNGPLTVAISKSSAGGTATIAATSVTMVNGAIDILITEGGTWLAADTNTLTVTLPTIMGAAVTGNTTSVETMT